MYWKGRIKKNEREIPKSKINGCASVRCAF